MYQMKNKVLSVPLRVLGAPVRPNCIAQSKRDPGHCHPKLFTQLSKQVNNHIYHSSSCRCQTQSHDEQSVISTHWQSHPTLSLNFNDSFKDESALHRTALVIITKQKKSDLMSVIFRDQILSKSQQSLLSSKLPHHKNKVLYPVFSSLLTGFICS